jgi:hypothetical protein
MYSLYLSFNQAVNATNLIFKWKRANVILERIWYPSFLEPYIADSFQDIPVLGALRNDEIWVIKNNEVFVDV